MANETTATNKAEKCLFSLNYWCSKERLVRTDSYGTIRKDRFVTKYSLWRYLAVALPNHRFRESNSSADREIR
jgi:hypothetical protein